MFGYTLIAIWKPQEGWEGQEPDSVEYRRDVLLPNPLATGDWVDVGDESREIFCAAQVVHAPGDTRSTAVGAMLDATLPQDVRRRQEADDYMDSIGFEPYDD